MRPSGRKLGYQLGMLLLGCISYSQQVVVKDITTAEPLSGAVITDLDSSASVITNADGLAFLGDFIPDQNLQVKMLGYRVQFFNFEASHQLVQVLLEPESLELDEIILSVARSSNLTTQISEKVSVIEDRDIEFNQPATGADLLSISPGVRIQKSQGGGGSPVLRGFEANRVLLVVDGIRLNNAIYRSGHHQYALTIDPNTIDRVEIIFGSSSVAYGSDALGGVIHYYTKSPKLSPEGHQSYSLKSLFSSAESNLINNFTADIGFKNWGSFTSLTYSDFGDIKIGKVRNHGFEKWGKTPLYSLNSRDIFSPFPTKNSDALVQQNTGYQQLDLFQKFVFQLNSNNQLSLNMQLSTSSDIPRFDKLIETRDELLRFAEWYYGPQKRLLLGAQYKLFTPWKFMSQGRITFAYQNIKESRINRPFFSTIRSTQEESVNVINFNADFNFSLEEVHKIAYGFEGVYNTVLSRAFSLELVPEFPNIENFNPRLFNQGRYNWKFDILGYENYKVIPTRYPSDGSNVLTFAAYGNWIWNFHPKFSLNLGIRFNYMRVFARWNELANVNALLRESRVINRVTSETASLTYRPDESTQWNFIFSSGFRSPNIDDLGKIRESASTLLVPNDFLQAEYAYNLDIGYNKKFKETDYVSFRSFGTILSRHIGRAAFEIVGDDSTPDPKTIIYNGEVVETIANKNLGDRFLLGASFDSKLKLLPQLNLLTSLTFTHGIKHAQYSPLPSISPLFGDAKLRYENKLLNVYVGMVFSDRKRPEDYSLGGEDGLEETPLVGFVDGGSVYYEEPIYYGAPGWMRFDFNSQVKISDSASIRFGIENITDVHYKPFASGISAPGRSFRIGFTYRF